jgi:glyoxylase-like metal-dependent hydrolase (beta-lactamase superfamily II)
VKIHAFHCGGDMADMAVFDPFDANVGTKVYDPYFFYLVEHPRGLVLFDSGLHPAMRTDLRGRIGDSADAFVVEMAEDDDVVSKLAKLDLRPDDIECVVQSHLHFDHAGGLEFLAHAPVYLQDRELLFARNPPIYQRDIYVPADFEHDLDWRLLEGDHDLFGDGTLRIISTPGHTAGHQSLLVRLQSRSILLMSDASYLVEKMRQRLLPAVVWSPDAMVASWERIEAIEQETRAQLVCTHELNFREHVPQAPDACWE